MRAPEKILTTGPCSRVCGGCPMAERCHPKTIISSSIVSFYQFKLEKSEALAQVRSSLAGGPVPELKAATCNDCKDGSCSKHQKAA